MGKNVYSVKCEVGRYCLESCPALEAAQRVINLISVCGYICGACKYKHHIASKTEAIRAAANAETPNEDKLRR